MLDVRSSTSETSREWNMAHRLDGCVISMSTAGNGRRAGELYFGQTVVSVIIASIDSVAFLSLDTQDELFLPASAPHLHSQPHASDIARTE